MTRNGYFWRFLKRLLDITIATVLLVLLSPFILLIILLNYCFEGRPIFYVSSRMITSSQSIRTYKFRTMIPEAALPDYQLNERFMRNGFLDIPLSCEIYTPIGRLLERTQLVEILQLINVLRDGMSLVGNRPLPRANVELLKKHPDWEGRFASPCGLTGISQVVGKWDLQADERIELEKKYALVYWQGNVIKCDFYIMFCTISLILFGKKLPLKKAHDWLDSCLYQKK